jgi:hypothetical protein
MGFHSHSDSVTPAWWVAGTERESIISNINYKWVVAYQSWVMHACNTSYARGRGRKIECSRPVWGKVSEALSQKIPTKGLGAGDVAQVVELKYETLGSTPSTAKNNNNNKF